MGSAPESLQAAPSSHGLAPKLAVLPLSDSHESGGGIFRRLGCRVSDVALASTSLAAASVAAALVSSARGGLDAGLLLLGSGGGNCFSARGLPGSATATPAAVPSAVGAGRAAAATPQAFQAAAVAVSHLSAAPAMFAKHPARQAEEQEAGELRPLSEVQVHGGAPARAQAEVDAGVLVVPTGGYSGRREKLSEQEHLSQNQHQKEEHQQEQQQEQQRKQEKVKISGVVVSAQDTSATLLSDFDSRTRDHGAQSLVVSNEPSRAHATSAMAEAGGAAAAGAPELLALVEEEHGQQVQLVWDPRRRCLASARRLAKDSMDHRQGPPGLAGDARRRRGRRRGSSSGSSSIVSEGSSVESCEGSGGGSAEGLKGGVLRRLGDGAAGDGGATLLSHSLASASAAVAAAAAEATESAREAVEDWGLAAAEWWRHEVVQPARRFAMAAFVPRDVAAEYTSYMRWKVAHRTVSSFCHALATQSLLRALGVGGRQSAALSAGVQWVLKDGVGKMGRLLYMGAYGHTFDCHLKRARFRTSALFTLSLGLDMLTPVFPRHFLLLATLANVGKSIGLATYLATTPAFHRAFALADNMADISAKGQAQTVVADNVGLALALAVGLSGGPGAGKGAKAAAAAAAAAASASRLARSAPLLLYPVLASLDLFCIAQELRSVLLSTLNTERLEIAADTWLTTGRVPSLMDVSRREKLFLPPSWSQRIPLQVGSLRLHASALSSTPFPHRIASLLSPSSRPYVLSLCTSASSSSSSSTSSSSSSSSSKPLATVSSVWANAEQLRGRAVHAVASAMAGHASRGWGDARVAISFRADASPADKMMALMQACYLRKRLLDLSEAKHEKASSPPLISPSPYVRHVPADAGTISKLVEESQAEVEQVFPMFLRDLQEQGWRTDRLLVSPQCAYRRGLPHIPSSLQPSSQPSQGASSTR